MTAARAEEQYGRQQVSGNYLLMMKSCAKPVSKWSYRVINTHERSSVAH